MLPSNGDNLMDLFIVVSLNIISQPLLLVLDKASTGMTAVKTIVLEAVV